MLLALMTTCLGLFSASAQEKITLSGFWEYSLGDSLHYNDQVILPGSLLTNGKGDKVTVNTKWTGSPFGWEKTTSAGVTPSPMFRAPSRLNV